MIPSRNYIIRLSNYRGALKRFKGIGFVKVFSDNLADAIGITSAQVRKDFSLFDISGNKKGGYNVDELIARLDKILGKDQIQKVVLAGAGKIGSALMNYKGFEDENIKIVAAFDSDTQKSGKHASIPIYPIAEMEEFIKKNRIYIGVIAVPHSEAQAVMDIMAEAGVKGVLNFAPIRLRTKDDIIINDVNLAFELENVVYFVNASRQSGNKR